MHVLNFALFVASTACAPALPPSVSPALPVEDAVQLETSTGTLHGTLLRPASRGVAPVVLLIAGSGPTDRDGNSAGLPGANNSLKLLAEGLAVRGIATLRYDKRGVGASLSAGPLEDDLRFETYVDDAAAWTRQLQADPRFSTVSVLGHSEGSLIGMLAAERAGAGAFISVAGIARSAGEVLRDQLRPRLPPALWEESERILAALEAGERVDSVPAALQVLYRPSVQPYLISWLRYVPAEVLARLTPPVLLVQGTTDIQVGVGEAHALQQALPAAELRLIEGMNHVLKEVPPDLALQQASYSEPSLPVVPELLEQIHAFVMQQ
jgi:uncharacterized protein